MHSFAFAKNNKYIFMKVQKILIKMYQVRQSCIISEYCHDKVYNNIGGQNWEINI